MSKSSCVIVVGVDRSGTHLLAHMLGTGKKNIEGDAAHHVLVRKLASCELERDEQHLARVRRFYEQGWVLDKTHQMLWLMDYVDAHYVGIIREKEAVIESSLRHPTVPRDARNAKECEFWGGEVESLTVRERLAQRWVAHRNKIIDSGIDYFLYEDIIRDPQQVIDYGDNLGIGGQLVEIERGKFS